MLTGEVPYLGTGSYHSLKGSKVQDKRGGPSVIDFTPTVLPRFDSVAKTPTVKSQAQVKKLLPNSLTSEPSVASRPGSGPRGTTLSEARKRAQKLRLVRYCRWNPDVQNMWLGRMKGTCDCQNPLAGERPETRGPLV